MSRDDALSLRGAWLLVARVGWLAIVVATYTLFVANIPAYFASLHLLHAPSGQAFTVQLTPGDVQMLQAMGLSLHFYAICMLGICLLFQFTYASIGALLFWRRSDERAALVTSFAMMMLPFGFANITLQTLPPGWLWFIPVVSALGNGSLLLSAYVFPDGRFVPHWTRWLALLMVGYWAVMAISPSWQLDRSVLSLGIFFGFIVVVLLIQMYRYRYLSTPRQRQQTRWVLFAIVLAAVGNIGARLLYYVVLLPLSHGSPLAYALEISLIMCSMLPIPITLAIAILSSRLWGIDVLINRTLVYGVLTITLASIYVGLVFILQALLRTFTGQMGQSPLVTVSSTLAIAALFQPLRHRIQKIIDRRFYRHKYDAARTLAAFSATLHNEVDLAQLSEHLVTVVEETMQPTFVSLWLRVADQTKEGRTRLLPRIDEEKRET